MEEFDVLLNEQKNIIDSFKELLESYNILKLPKMTEFIKKYYERILEIIEIIRSEVKKLLIG